MILGLLAGLALRLYFILRWAHVAGDSMIYGNLAENMLQHHIYGFTEGAIRQTLIRLPGYPLFLSACFAIFGMEHYIPVLYVQLVLDLVGVWLVADLARRLVNERAGMWALWLGALCPFTANYVAAPLTEAPSIFCAALAFYSLERWNQRLREGARWSHWIWPMGLSLAFAVLLRQDRSLLTVAIVPAMAWMAWQGPVRPRRSLTQVAVVALIVLAPLGVWTGRNWHVFHVFQPLAPKYANDQGEFVSYGFQRWYRTWAIEFKSTDDIYWPYDGSPIVLADVPERAFDSAEQRQRTARIFDRYNYIRTATGPVDRAFGVLAAERVAANPLRYYVELPIARVADMWLRPRTEMIPGPMDWWRWREHPMPSLRIAAYAALNLAYLLLAVIGVRRWKRQNWNGQRAMAYALIGFVLLRSAMLLTVDNSEPRYTIDCYPVVILLAAFAFQRSRTRTKVITD
jgi:hypothetical protein